MNTLSGILTERHLRRTTLSGRVMDFGKDFYAAQTYNNDPLGRAIVVGWMRNWQYTQVVPTSPWRGIFALPRILSVLQNQDQTQTGASGPNSYFLR
jgi:sucrose-6-phosphate hydrolase SacC (GH32 family)